MRGARLGHPAHRDGGRTHRVPPPGPGDHPHREHYQQHQHQQRTTTTTQATLTSSVTSTPAAGRTTATATAADGAPPRDRRAGRATRGRAGRAAGYVVQPGDTLSGIAAALGVPGGWPALYAANRRAIGPDPGLIRPGTVLTLPGPTAPARYTITAGDTLSGIAAALAVPGGWPALYAANRPAIGPDPDAIRAGTVLAIPRPAPGRRRRPHRARRRPHRAPASTPPLHPDTGAGIGAATGTGHSAGRRTGIGASRRQPAQPGAERSGRRRPRSLPALPTGGLPRWLEIVLAAAGLLIATAFLTEPALAIARRRRRRPPGRRRRRAHRAGRLRTPRRHPQQAGRHRLRAAPARRRPARDPARRPPRAGPGPLRGTRRRTSASPPTGPENDAASPKERPGPQGRRSARGGPSERLEGAAGSAALPVGRRDGPVPEGLHQRRHVPSVLGRELVDAGDQQLAAPDRRGPRDPAPRRARRSSAFRSTRRRRRGPPRPARRAPWRARRSWRAAAAAPGSASWPGCTPSTGAARRGGRPRRRTIPAPTADPGSVAAAG